ncbi:transporter [Lithospermum erythrorhizon]|uniref:Transporter n=1 Tax=Lithospermum erythrorhizon TaxID=34254 RepID=A0AAV3RNZ6_LITER
MSSSTGDLTSLLENGILKTLCSDHRKFKHGRSAHNLSTSSLRMKSENTLVSQVQYGFLRGFLANVQEVILGTKLSLLFITIPLAIMAQILNFGRPLVFALSLLGLTPLAERVSFLTEQIAFYTGPSGEVLIVILN